MRVVVVVVGALAVAWPVMAQPRLPDDVLRFIERRDACDHFRGEDPYDAARRRFLEQQTRRFCLGTDAELERLRQKYRNDTAVTARLDQYEPGIEASPAK